MSFFAPLFSFLYPTSIIFKKPQLSQLFSIFEILFNVYISECSTFKKREHRINSHLSKQLLSLEPSSVPFATLSIDLFTSNTNLSTNLPTKQSQTLPHKKPHLKLSSALLPLSATIPAQALPSASIPLLSIPITDITQLLHINHSHLVNLINLLQIFILVLMLFKAELKYSNLPVTIANMQ
jgi:hypothetical protein